MDEKKAFLDITLPFGKVVFYSVDEVEEWVKKELDFWKWPQNYDKDIRDLRLTGIICSVFSPLSRIQAAINAIKNNQDENQNNRLVAGLENVINETYKPNAPKPAKLLHSSQPRSQYIHSLIETDPIRAACIAAFYMHAPEIDRLHPAALDGAVAGILFDLGIKGSCEAEKASLEQLRAEWSSEVSKARSINENNAEAAKEWKIQTADDRSQQQNKFNELIDTSQSNVDEFKKRISAEIALKGPVTYWSGKARSHTVKSRWFLVSTIAAFIAVGAYFAHVIRLFAPNLVVTEITLRHIGLLAVGATFGVWLIRILVRNYLSHVHLSHDAEERVAMMKTYLALLEEGKLEDNHRQLILQALFRPASTGIVKDDAAPPFMAEWLKRTTGTDGG